MPLGIPAAAVSRSLPFASPGRPGAPPPPFPPPRPSHDVWQWGTLVNRNHRGHRLGMAVKVRNLEQLAAASSGRVRVLTCNAETNRHMVDINVRLGFEAIEVCPMMELRIDNAAGALTEQRAQVSAATT